MDRKIPKDIEYKQSISNFDALKLAIKQYQFVKPLLSFIRGLGEIILFLICAVAIICIPSGPFLFMIVFIAHELIQKGQSIHENNKIPYEINSDSFGGMIGLGLLFGIINGVVWIGFFI